MNSLEFIDKEIANIREFLELDDVLCLQTEEDYKFWYDRLKTLQQIKAELEAWEICKKHSYINICDSNSNCFTITIWFNTENCYFKSCASYEECLKVKKALEVKDEKL